MYNTYNIVHVFLGGAVVYYETFINYTDRLSRIVDNLVSQEFGAIINYKFKSARHCGFGEKGGTIEGKVKGIRSLSQMTMHANHTHTHTHITGVSWVEKDRKKCSRRHHKCILTRILTLYVYIILLYKSEFFF